MKIPKKHQRLAQRILNAQASACLVEDGVFGPKSVAAAGKWIKWSFSGRPTNMRWCAAILQMEAIQRKLNPGEYDGLYGSQTSDAADRILYELDGIELFGRPDENTTSPGPRCWNPNTSHMRAFYGAEGTQQSLAESPYKLRLDWDLRTSISRFSCHSKIKARVEKAMKETLAHYGEEKIKEMGLNRFGGCLNVRLKRGGTTPSTHSWGTAIDWFPTANTLRETSRTARFARPEYSRFMDIWAENGFMSLGRCYDFDWMHVQANPS